ncbi:MAG: hypothetical protein ABFD70_12360 [Syntrophaceae bacterium]|nr:hypothetical protein [Deltaproteobacteria bacterium]
MGHTFLFTQARWLARGLFFDAKGKALPAEGEISISHQGNLWVNEGIIKVLGERPAEIRNRYEIVPIPEGTSTTTWTSVNPAIGRFMGSFAVVGDSILSCFQSEDAAYSGMEYLRQEESHQYQNRGVLLLRGERVSSWAVTLRKSG